jgi:hypothetical protein
METYGVGLGEGPGVGLGVGFLFRKKAGKERIRCCIKMIMSRAQSTQRAYRVGRGVGRCVGSGTGGGVGNGVGRGVGLGIGLLWKPMTIKGTIEQMILGTAIKI